MCGIFAYTGDTSDAGEKIVNGLRSLEYRGYDSWGAAVKKSDGKVYIEKQVGKIAQGAKAETDAKVGIGHTRWATHGGVTVANAHPHTNKDKSIVLVHNGIVENFQDHKAKLEKKGYKFKSETDTEALVYLLEEILKKEPNKVKAVQMLFDKISGMNAIIVMFSKSEEFVAVKNGSPLVFGFNKKGYFLASDAVALAPHTKEVIFLEDNTLLYFKKGEFKVLKNGKKQKTEFMTLPYSSESTTMGKYPHFMIKEINEQPGILHQIAKTQKGNVENAADLVKKSFGAYVLGCGTSYFAALTATYIFSTVAKRHINAQIGSEFAYVEDFIKPKSLVIPLSQSGETIDILVSVKRAKEKGAKILAVTNVLGSTIYREADARLLLNAGPEKCVLATKSFTSKIALLFLMAHSLAGTYKKGTEDIENAANEVSKLIKNPQLKKLARKLKDKRDIFVLGRGISYPTALESALKIKEVTYIHAEGFAGGELKHGVMALIEKGVPVIVFNPDDETYHDTLSSAYEVKARGAYVIGISSKPNDVYDEFIEVKNCNGATVIPNVVVAQLLGYYLALAKGTDPDKPRNLAKSVTVK